MKLYKAIDLNGNGMISFNELVVEFRKAINLNRVELKDHVIKLGYNFAKDLDTRWGGGNSNFNSNDAFIEFKEFRMFLKYI